MSGQEQSGEKTFAPTDKRKRDAAQKGDVLRSKELATAAVMLVGAGAFLAGGPWLHEALAETLRIGLVWDRAALDDFAPGKAMLAALMALLPPVLVLGVLVIGVSLVSQLGFGSGVWVSGNLAPKASRINPLSGLKRMFGLTGLIEMGKGLLKVGLLGTIAWFWAQDRIAMLIGLGGGNLSSQLGQAWQALISLLFALGGGLVLIALVDVPVQYVRRMGRLKMSLQDMRDENKEAEGSPERKGAIRERQRMLARGALAPAMKEAQFVITNPTHFSVALAYDPAKAAAPVVLAKGRGDKALAIRDLAAELQLPTLEYPQLARAVYFTTRERQMIREELYVAVAALLAFVFSLKRGETPQRPAVNVPVELCFDADGKLAVAGG
ncbi:MAG: EscU/YscU/HrcU family type III secretion system export apparatus switch protein [Novosphingobium sp.]|nr:EscU/YscU/HrcU family type III secretion system export apparatus switch protein [Novosphingobium sp.]